MEDNIYKELPSCSAKKCLALFDSGLPASLIHIIVVRWPA
jgi:hypothetical protein